MWASIKKWFLLLFLALIAFSQPTIIEGYVYDASNKEPIPFANVFIKGTTTGTSTDINGHFYLHIPTLTNDTLVVSVIGYKKEFRKIKLRTKQKIDFYLAPEEKLIQEVEIKAKKKEKEPIRILMDKVFENKKQNDPDKLQFYEHTVYTKIQIDINNLSPSIKEKKFFKSLGFIFDYLDSSQKKNSIPIFITETLSKFYSRREPKAQKEIILATKASGIEEKTTYQFLAHIHQGVNIYKNYVEIFGRNFISPLHSLGWLYYKYYLVDSQYIGKYKCYKVLFEPRLLHEPTFYGTMWIHDTTFGVKKITATMSGKTNINFIQEFTVNAEYEYIDNEVWMPIVEELLVDFALNNDMVGFYGKRKAIYTDIKINKEKELDFFLGPENVIVSEDIDLVSDSILERHRPEPLSSKEKNIYNLVDTIKKVKAFNTYIDIIQTILWGYKKVGKFEVGPYFSLISYGPIEGLRIRFGIRNHEDLFNWALIEPYIAYGFSDRLFKGGVSLTLYFYRKRWTSLTIKYQKDLEQLGESSAVWQRDNIIYSVARRSPSTKLDYHKTFLLSFTREFFQGFEIYPTFMYKEIKPGGILSFSTFNDPNIDKINFYEASLIAHFNYREKVIKGDFNRVSVPSRYPTFEFMGNIGKAFTKQQKYKYGKIILKASDGFWLNPFGYSKITIESGKMFGSAPFPLLFLPKGNETYYYDIESFNLMNYYEFVTSEYISIFYEHKFKGFFLDKIPLLNKLQIRELLTLRILQGLLSSKNKLNLSPDLLDKKMLNSLSSVPYIEGSIGAENILKFIRFDFIVRLTYRNLPNAPKQGFRMMFWIDF